ncbi:TPA: hypothetical protein QDB32_003954 [Burkholderia vietnamiensis]|nr:hypothetical protein [Burkholderia vietnamiensis]HDR9145431.1 hypothetical protein [Burkholderia vietnamiensis]
MTTTLLFLELAEHGSARLEFERYGRTLESYTRRLNSAGRWAAEGYAHAPLIAWLPDALSEAEAAAERASAARQRPVVVAPLARSRSVISGRDFILFEQSMEPALLGYLPFNGRRTIRQQRDADKLGDFCAAIVKVFFQAPDLVAQQQASRDVAKTLTAKYGGGSVTSAIQWLAGKTGEASLQAILLGDAELPGALSISEVVAICKCAKAGMFKGAA